MERPSSIGGGAAGGYLLSALVCALLAAIPFLAVSVPPITDLPQQTAQIRLLFEALSDDGSAYSIQWWHPNKLGYGPLLLAWLAAPPIAAGRLAVLGIGLLWVGSIHALAFATGRPAAAAALASIFFFNHLTYWGLLNALIGLPVFAGWLVMLERLPPRPGWRDGSKILALACLLYLAHVLWLAAGLLWLALSGVVRRLPPSHLALRLAWVSPALLTALAWYPQLRNSGFVSETFWGRPPWGRLHPEWLLNSALGGLEGRAEATVMAGLLVWLVLGLAAAFHRHRSRREDGTRDGDAGAPDGRKPLALAGLMFLALGLCLPGVLQNTIFFASRWLPAAAVLLVLACPAPPLRPWLRHTVPYLLLASLTITTASTWIDFEDTELDGLHQALAAVSPGERVLGLDFVRTSQRIQGFPFYHLYAYAQVLHGNELARSFANEGSSLVVYRDLPRKLPWTEGLDWRARKIRRSDVDHFGYVIIFADPETHAVFLHDERLEPVTADRPWRLYRVRG